MATITLFAGKQRFRLISGRVSMYTTAAAIRRGIGDFMSFNESAQQALAELEKTRSGAGSCDKFTCGIGCTFGGIQIQLDMVASSSH